MKDASVKQEPSWSFVICSIFFLLSLLGSAFGFRSAERAAAGHGFQLHFAIAVPWIFVLLGGAIVFQSARRDLLKRDTSATLLLMMGFALSYAYEAMGTLSRLIR